MGLRYLTDMSEPKSRPATSCVAPKGAHVLSAVGEGLSLIERRRYRNPPIDEALCQFRFEPDSGWDSTLADRLHAELQVDYLTSPRELRVVERRTASER